MPVNQSNSSAPGCHREAPRAAGLKQKHSARGSLKPSLYFQDRKNAGSLHNGWIPSHKISLLEFPPPLWGWKPQVSSASGIPWKMCLYHPWARNQEATHHRMLTHLPRHTDCTKKMDFILFDEGLRRPWGGADSLENTGKLPGSSPYLDQGEDHDSA